jgi:starch phosphorylase
LVQGVDRGSTCRGPARASGTRDEGRVERYPQLSTLDGWWTEGFTGRNGWSLPPATEGADPDAADAESLYRLLEDEVVPLYYARDPRGVSPGWVDRMKMRCTVRGAVHPSVYGGTWASATPRNA